MIVYLNQYLTWISPSNHLALYSVLSGQAVRYVSPLNIKSIMSYLQYQTRKITAKRQPQSHDNQKYKEGIILNSAALLKLDIVWGTEPWLNGIKPWTNPVTDAMKSSEIFPWNYYVYRNDRGTWLYTRSRSLCDGRKVNIINRTNTFCNWMRNRNKG